MNLKKRILRAWCRLPRYTKCLECGQRYWAWGQEIWTKKLCSPACRKAWLRFGKEAE